MYELPDICWIVNRAAVIDAIAGFANAIDAFILAKIAIAL